MLLCVSFPRWEAAHRDCASHSLGHRLRKYTHELRVGGGRSSTRAARDEAGEAFDGNHSGEWDVGPGDELTWRMGVRQLVTSPDTLTHCHTHTSVEQTSSDLGDKLHLN